MACHVRRVNLLKRYGRFKFADMASHVPTKSRRGARDKLIKIIFVSKPPHILLRSSWQTVNIGDIAHTPGVLALLERHIPEAKVTLWASNVRNGVEAMLRRRFPNVEIVQDEAAIKAAIADADFLLHGSGPFVVAAKDLWRWHTQTGKPYGIYGVTMGVATQNLWAEAHGTRDVVNHAKFVYFRDSHSLAWAQEQGYQCPILELGQDGAFAVDLRDDERAHAFLRENGLERGEFLCCIARLRLTPYWKVKPWVEFDAEKHARNEAMKEHDMAPLREAIIAVVRGTGKQVLVCPEDATQMEVGRENLIEKLPADVRGRVVWRENFWLTDEALSTYVMSSGLFGAEMHSPIMCIGNGVPALVCRWEEQTTKGFMWRDIGLGEWLFDFEVESDLEKVAPMAREIARHPDAARAKAAAANARVQARFAQTMGQVRRELGI